MSNSLHIAREAPRTGVSLEDSYFPSGSQPIFHKEEFLWSSSLPQKVGSENWGWRRVKCGIAHSMVITLNCLAFHGCIYISAPDHTTNPQHIPAMLTPDESQQGYLLSQVNRPDMDSPHTERHFYMHMVPLRTFRHWLVRSLYITGSFVYSFQSYFCYTNMDALLHKTFWSFQEQQGFLLLVLFHLIDLLILMFPL